MESLKTIIENRIWKTKRARIQTEKRLEKLETRNNILNVWYSIFLVILSSISYTKPLDTDIDLDFFILVGAIISLVFSIYCSIPRYKERSYEMRICYTELSKLEIELKKSNIEEKEILTINEKYQELLKEYENHSTMDYLKILEYKNFNYYLLVLRDFIINISLYLIPILVLYVYYLFEKIL